MVIDRSILRRSRALQEMMELARAIVSDGKVSEVEARRFQEWTDKNPDMLGVHPLVEIVAILRNVLADGHLSAEEAGQLREILKGVSGG